MNELTRFINRLRKQGGQRGFTLTELLVAICLGLILVVAASQLVGNVFDAFEQGDKAPGAVVTKTERVNILTSAPDPSEFLGDS